MTRLPGKCSAVFGSGHTWARTWLGEGDLVPALPEHSISDADWNFLLGPPWEMQSSLTHCGFFEGGVRNGLRDSQTWDPGSGTGLWSQMAWVHLLATPPWTGPLTSLTLSFFSWEERGLFGGRGTRHHAPVSPLSLQQLCQSPTLNPFYR